MFFYPLDILWWSGDEALNTNGGLLHCVVCSVVELCGLSVVQSSGQCIDRVVRLVVWGGYERCMTSWYLRKHFMFHTVDTLPLFSISVEL